MLWCSDTNMFVLALILLFVSLTNGQYYMSAAGMRTLFTLELNMSRAFLTHYRAQLRRVSELENLLEQQKLIDNITSAEDLRYISNPADSFKIFKRFTQGWRNISRFESEKFSSPVYERYIEVYDNSKGFSQHTELRGSILGLIKLQETYQISVRKFVEGLNKYSHKMRILDIFLIGYYAMGYKYYNLGRLWLEEAYHRYHLGSDKDLYPYDYHKLLEALVWCSDREMDFESAASYTEEQLEVQHSLQVEGDLKWYQNAAEYCKRGPPCKKRMIIGPDDGGERDYLDRLHKICRGEEKMTQEDINDLYCSYYKPTYEFYLKPMKLEVLYHDPHVLYFHNLLSDSEADALIDKARGNLQTARVFSSRVYQQDTQADYRSSKSYFLEKDDVLANTILARVGRLVNINTRYAEQLQIANYGIGGNYESHYDYASWPQDNSVFGHYNFGNRIATMLMYLSDVLKGGNTAFVSTGPGVSASPKKGAGVFWYNLMRNGEGDEKTRHAGCPILFGEKWIANYWIHEWGHEFRRPCALDPNL